jgi:hypothetical protein
VINLFDVTDVLTVCYNRVMCSAAAEVCPPGAAVLYIGSGIYQDWPMFICQLQAETISMGVYNSSVGSTGLHTGIKGPSMSFISNLQDSHTALGSTAIERLRSMDDLRRGRYI